MRVGVVARSFCILGLSVALSCRPTPDIPPEPWVEKPIEDWPDFVLTNDIHFSDTVFSGIGNAFLVDLGWDTVAVSVKHIFLFLQDQRGFETIDLGPDFVEWEMRSLKQPERVLGVGRPLNENPSEGIGDFNTLQVRDWLAFRLPAGGSGFYPLRVRPSYLKKGEAAFAVGRSQAERESTHPRITPLRIYEALGPYYFVESMDPEADPVGTSGSPVIDKNGHLVGIVSGATGRLGVVASVEYFLEVVESQSLKRTIGSPTHTATMEGQPLFELVTGDRIAEDGGATRGVAWGDFDEDGDPDLYTTNTGGQENALYRNLHFDTPSGGPPGDSPSQGAPTHPMFERIAGSDPSGSGLTAAYVASSEGVAWVDYDADGDLDLFIVNRNEERDNLFRNDGSGRFTPVLDSGLTDRSAGASMACWADADGDGWLDVFVIGYDGASNRLFRNAGGGRFVEVSESPMNSGNGEARACGWADANGDGLPDVYVANNRDAPNRFFLNLGGWQFEEITRGHFVEAIGYSYGVSWADYDADGDLDLFVANFDRTNVLYRNNGEGALSPDAASLLSTDQGGASKGHAWADFDLDGDLDLFVANGTYGPDMRNFIYLNDGRGGFTRDMRGEVAIHADTSAGAAWADFDLDGDLDLFVASWGSSDQVNRLYRNTTSETSGRSWLGVTLQGDGPNTFAIGARVTCVVTIDGVKHRLTRWNWPATGYGSQNQMLAHFGLGDATVVDSLIVEWPDGTEEVLTGVTPGLVRVSQSGRHNQRD